jgi:hypothetical protein
VRDAGRHRGLAGRVLALAGGKDLAEDHLVHLRSVDFGARQRLLDGHGTQIVRGGIGKGSVERADGGARRSDDDDVTHVFLQSCVVR